MNTQKIPQTIKAKVHELEPVVRIGKSGLTQGAIDELNKQLKKKKLIKVKLLGSCIEGKEKRYKKEVMEEIANKTNSKLIHRVGFIGVFYKEKL